ncbi:MAG: sulfatase-like hydrolase/transferase [Agathobacter sp.]|nr:sulfatase-like hydrolase/transferase [Agathobacter sp.]
MKKILDVLKEKMSFIKEKFFTKHEKQHSEKYYKLINILNSYSIIWHALLSMFVVFLVELASRWSIVSAFSFIAKSPWAFFYNSFIVFASLTLVYLFRRRAFARLIISSFWIILGIINGIVLSNRVTPFGFADLTVVSDLLTMLDTYVSPTMMAIIIAASLIFIIICALIYIHGPVYQGKQRRIVSLASILTIVFIAIPATTTVAQENNIIASYFTNIAQGYMDYGFVYSFSSGFVNWGMKEPADYEEAVIDALMQAVESEKAVTTVTTENGPNIITVLLESFVDPNEFNFMTYSQDPTPFFHYLEDNYTSGYLTMPVVGAGTANAEFEILTGMRLHYFGTGEYPYKTVLKEVENCESIASYLKSIGYGTHAVHNNGGNFYSRVNAFSMMGFDSFTSKELMNITEFTPNEGWAEDSILAEETMKTLTSTPGPDLTYVITVGQHGVYPEEKVIEEPYCEVYGLPTEGETNAWTYYMHQANKTDQFIQELITYLEEFEEDTIVVFWGDHLPTFGLEDSEMVSGDIYKTKYVTWNNFGLEQNDKDLYAYQLMADIFNQVGIHDGTMVAYHQTQWDNPDNQAYLDGIEQLQYDILYGNRYCYDGDINKYPATDIIMGIDDVIISEMYPYTDEEGTNWVVLKGESFTKWSRVYVNGDKIGTTYVSGNELWIKASKIEDGDKVVVNQNGSKSTIFRSSNEFVYQIPAVDDVAETQTTEGTENTESSENAEGTTP